MKLSQWKAEKRAYQIPKGRPGSDVRTIYRPRACVFIFICVGI